MFNDEKNKKKILKNKTLFYVACSRTIKNLIIVKVITISEEKKLKDLFYGFDIIKI